MPRAVPARRSDPHAGAPVERQRQPGRARRRARRPRRSPSSSSCPTARSPTCWGSRRRSSPRARPSCSSSWSRSRGATPRRACRTSRSSGRSWRLTRRRWPRCRRRSARRHRRAGWRRPTTGSTPLRWIAPGGGGALGPDALGARGRGGDASTTPSAMAREPDYLATELHERLAAGPGGVHAARTDRAGRRSARRSDGGGAARSREARGGRAARC